MPDVAYWDFFVDKQGRWSWRCRRSEGAEAQSKHHFASRTDCIADAIRHGYLAREPGCQPESKATELY
jgi:hypothetical protein